jgi:hypothetical protein
MRLQRRREVTSMGSNNIKEHGVLSRNMRLNEGAWGLMKEEGGGTGSGRQVRRRSKIKPTLAGDVNA